MHELIKKNYFILKLERVITLFVDICMFQKFFKPFLKVKKQDF